MTKRLVDVVVVFFAFVDRGVVLIFWWFLLIVVPFIVLALMRCPLPRRSEGHYSCLCLFGCLVEVLVRPFADMYQAEKLSQSV